MVPKLHKKGSSFKGAAAYLLHDKGRASTSRRVMWSQTRNLALHDPQMAWRIMAATAMDQDRLKAQAGVKSTGRKSNKSVLHLTLAWHPEEKDALTREEMKRAATGAIRALGAEEHQALIIAHDDEDHPHIHILINRVHPQTGRMLSSSKEKLELSRWAEKYEKERGKIYCEQRVANNEAREMGEYTRGNKDQNRRLFEEIKKGAQIANDNRTEAERIRQHQKEIDAELSRQGRDLAQKHSEEWRTLNQAFESEKHAIRAEIENLRGNITEAIENSYRAAKSELVKEHRREFERFLAHENKFAGRIINAKEAFENSSIHNGAPNPKKLRDFFKFASSKNARRRALKGRQKSEMRALEKEQRLRHRLATKYIKEAAAHRRAQNDMDFLSRREQLIQKQEGERRDLKRRWRSRHAERKRDWHDLRRRTEPKEKTKSEFARAASGKPADKRALKEEIKRRLLTARIKGRDGPGR